MENLSLSFEPTTTGHISYLGNNFRFDTSGDGPACRRQITTVLSYLPLFDDHLPWNYRHDKGPLLSAE